MSLPLPASECWNNSQCRHDYAELYYKPIVWVDSLFLAIFATAGLAQLYLGLVRYRATWLFAVVMCCGIILEIIGYAARLALYYDIFSETDFIIYLIGLTIGPAFFSAAIYLSLSRIINTFGEKLAICSAKKMTYIFVACDIVSLILQAAGGGIAASADTGTQDWTGIDIMIVGLSTQVASSTAFAAVALSLMLNVWRRPGQVKVDTVAFRRSWRFRGFLFAIALAVICILIRCSFRVAELSGGFTSDLANDQAMFLCLDGVCMILAVLVLTVMCPGMVFGPDWKHGGNKRDVEKQVSRSADSTGPISPVA